MFSLNPLALNADGSDDLLPGFDPDDLDTEFEDEMSDALDRERRRDDRAALVH